MTRTAALCTLAILLLLLGAGTASAAEITVQLPGAPLTVGETIKIPITITGADRLNTLTLQIRSSESALLDETARPLGGNYVINPANGKIVWYTLDPVSGDQTIAYLIVTPAVAEDIPVEIYLSDATAQPENTGETDDITAGITLKNVTIPVAGSGKTAEVAPTRTYVPTVTQTSSSGSNSGSGSQGVKTTVPTAQKTTAKPTPATPAATVTTVAPASSASPATPVPSMTQAPAGGILPFAGLLAALGILTLRRKFP